VWLGEKRFAWPVLCCVVVGGERGREFLVDAMGHQKGMCWHGQRGHRAELRMSPKVQIHTLAEKGTQEYEKHPQ